MGKFLESQQTKISSQTILFVCELLLFYLLGFSIPMKKIKYSKLKFIILLGRW